MIRHDPTEAADERTQLTQFLDYHRATMLMKVDGLDQAQMGATTAASDLTLAGLLKHLALVEDGWFRGTLLGEEPAPWWRDVDEDACERSRQAVASVASLDDLAVRRSKRTGRRFNLRWILLHMIEETARHNGHADLLREAIDGTTGE